MSKLAAIFISICFVFLTTIFGTEAHEHSTFNRWMCAETIRILGLNTGMVEGLPQVKTTKLGNIIGSDSQQTLQQVAHLETYADEPILYQFFLPKNHKPKKGLSRLLQQAEQYQFPSSLTTVSEFQNSKGEAHINFRATLPQSQDFEGRSIDTNLSAAALKPVLELMEPGDIAEVKGADGGLAKEVREFFAKKIRKHFLDLQAGDRRVFNVILTHRLKKMRNFDSERRAYEDLLQETIFDPHTLNIFSNFHPRDFIQSAGKVVLPGVKFQSPRDVDQMPIILSGYLRDLINTREVQFDFIKNFREKSEVKDFIGAEARLVGYSIDHFNTSFNSGLSAANSSFEFSLRFRIRDDAHDENFLGIMPFGNIPNAFSGAF
ncbi:MAG: hypothetical protein J0L93_08220 [Deltaproteobacteria bacterium]|nr:hypothetical protein [Deltaproteobacteria bacterium]